MTPGSHSADEGHLGLHAPALAGSPTRGSLLHTGSSNPGAEAAPLAALDRKTPGPGGGLGQQHPAPTVYQPWVAVGKRRKDELSILTHFSQSSLPRRGLALRVPSHLVTSVRETLTYVVIDRRLSAHQNHGDGTSLVARWLRIRLPMQGTWVRALVWEDPTRRGATKPVRHNY